jgi:hypothetical protein
MPRGTEAMVPEPAAGRAMKNPPDLPKWLI